MKKQGSVVLCVTAVMALSVLTGCGRLYDPADAETGIGTSVYLGAEGTAQLGALFQNALSKNGLKPGADEKVQTALNRALNRYTASYADLAPFMKAMRTALKKAGVPAEVYGTLTELQASAADRACCVVKMTAGDSLEEVFLPQAVEVLRRGADNGAFVYEVYLSVEDAGENAAAYALLLMRTRIE